MARSNAFSYTRLVDRTLARHHIQPEVTQHLCAEMQLVYRNVISDEAHETLSAYYLGRDSSGRSVSRPEREAFDAARDLAERHRRSLDAVRIRWPDGERYRGGAYLAAFADTVQEVGVWVPQHL